MHKIVNGSIDFPDGKTVTAGIYVEGIEDVRYVRAKSEDVVEGDTYLTLLGRAYDNSEGCLVKGHYREIICGDAQVHP